MTDVAAATSELEQLNRLISRTQRVLLRANTFFPFDFFPDEIVIDENQVNIIRRRFIATKDIESILISEIKSVTVSTSLFFSSLTISRLKPNYEDINIDYLPNQAAKDARQIIQGLMVSEKAEVDIAKIETNLLSKKLKELGREME